MVYPGATAHPFVDFREKISQLDPAQQGRVVGKSNLALINAGTVQWSDVVTRGRIRDLNQVVATKRLSLKQLEAAGVRPDIAQRAHASVHTPAHELEAKKRQALVDSLKAKGLDRDTLKRELGQRIAARIGISKPPGTTPPAVKPKPTPPPPVVPPVVVPLPKPRPKPKPAAVIVPVPILVHQRADYLVKSQVKPEVAIVSARREQVEARLATLPAEIEAARAEAAKHGRTVLTAKTTAELRAADKALGPAQERLRALEDRQRRLKDWETEVQANPRLIPAWEIADRIAEYARGEGGAKLKAILQVAEDVATELKALTAEGRTLSDTWTAAIEATLKLPRGSPERLALEAEQVKLSDRFTEWTERHLAVKYGTQERVLATFQAETPLVVIQAPADTANMRVVPLRPADQPAVEQGIAWIQSVTEQAGAALPPIPFGTVKDTAADRSHANSFGIALNPDTEVGVVVHEIGHQLDRHTGANATALEFLAHRVADEALRPMQEVAPELNYRPDEMGRKDRFDEMFPDQRAYYVGKDYQGKATEITAMGLEQLHRDAATFAQKDPEFVLLLLGILDGSLR